jgi:hypothetical protein
MNDITFTTRWPKYTTRTSSRRGNKKSRTGNECTATGAYTEDNALEQVSGLSNLLYVIIGTRRSSEESFSDFSFFGARKCPKKKPRNFTRLVIHCGKRGLGTILANRIWRDAGTGSIGRPTPAPRCRFTLSLGLHIFYLTSNQAYHRFPYPA